MAANNSIPDRCIQEVLTSPEDSELHGLPADVLTDEGPRCRHCFAEHGGGFVRSLECLRPISPLWIIANTDAIDHLLGGEQ